MRLFLYGTLLHPGTLSRRSGNPTTAQRRIAGTLHGWERVALPDTRWPTLRRRRGGRVTGAVVAVSAAAAGRLAAYEGSAYRLTPVAIATPTGTTTAHVWIAPGGTRRPWKE